MQVDRASTAEVVSSEGGAKLPGTNLTDVMFDPLLTDSSVRSKVRMEKKKLWAVPGDGWEIGFPLNVK